ncbi:hypothetical protein [Lysinibacillus telephonicus]|uniref:Uncharacterized protein n=1 Tax=Lysinibacillus telephonicus TaxID=1714840 RepID=A0A431UDX1_9BACI|nr:hypothetical protein [Lysinibacillus telephonicus]RTQ87116.1 hypothetical protein EKG35_19405 [Lysinibacillus telephonicus]
MEINNRIFNKTKANDSQLQTFLSGYDDRWRLTKLVSIKMTLEEREKLKRKLRSFYGPTFKEIEDDYVYNESTNGLIFSAISELLMYIEDYLVLISFIREDEEFIKKVVKYWAGNIGKVPERLNRLSDEDLLKAYMIPNKDYILEVMSEQTEEERNSSVAVYDEGVKNILEYTKSVIESFNKYRFFYNQYKHGLTVALRPFSGSINKAELQRRKTSFDGFPVCYDNETIEQAFKNGQQRAFVIPSLTPEIQPGLNKLQEEQNLLRYHYDSLVDINHLINIGKKVHLLIRTLIKNRFDYVIPEKQQANTFYLPYPRKRDSFSFAQILVVPFENPLSLNDFKVKI